MRRHLFDHVVEEADAGFDLHRPGAVQIDGADDARLPGVADGLTDAVAARAGAGGAQGGQQAIIDLGLQRDGQAQLLARRIGAQSIAAQGLDRARRVGGSGDDDRPDPGLQRHDARQGFGDAGALAAHAADAFGRLHHPRRVQRLHRQPHRDLGQGVGLQHAGQPRQRLRLRDRRPDPRPGQPIGQRQAAQHDQIGVVLDHGGGRGRLCELDQPLVHDQQDGGDALGHLGHGLGRAEGANDHGGGVGAVGRSGVEGGQCLIGLGVWRLHLLPVARGQTPDQLQPVRQATRRQHLIGADAIESGHAGGQRGRLGRIALQTVAARHERGIGRGQAHEPSPLVGEGGSRSETDEGAVSAHETEAGEASTPLIRAPPAPTFSLKGRRKRSLLIPRSSDRRLWRGPPAPPAAPVRRRRGPRRRRPVR